MTFAASFILIAIGLVLAVAVNATVAGFEIQTAGWIVAGVGLAGLIISLIFNRRDDFEE